MAGVAAQAGPDGRELSHLRGKYRPGPPWISRDDALSWLPPLGMALVAGALAGWAPLPQPGLHWRRDGKTSGS